MVIKKTQANKQTKTLKDKATPVSVKKKSIQKKNPVPKKQPTQKAVKTPGQAKVRSQIKAASQVEKVSNVKAAPDVAPVTKQSSGRGLSWLALLMAMVGLAVGGYAAYQTSLTKQLTSLKTSTFEERINLLSGDQNSVKGQVENVKNETNQRVQSFDKKLQTVNTTVEAHSKAIEDLQADETVVMAQMVGDLGQHVARWRLDELRSLLNQVEQYYQFTGDSVRAKAGLQLAQSGLANIDNPQLGTVKTAIAKDILNLNARQSVDVVTLHDELAGMKSIVAELVFTSDFNTQSTADEPMAEQNASDQATSNSVLAAGKTLLSDIGRLVKHKKVGTPLKPSMDESAKFVIQESLQLNIQAAMLALIRRDNQQFQLQIKRAVTAINTHFDTSQSQADTLLAALGSVSAKNISLKTEPITSVLSVLDRVILAGAK